MAQEKPIKYSIALIIYNEDRSRYLVVKRPSKDNSMPEYWGFPATSKKFQSEAWEDVVHRAAEIKLGVKISIVKCLGEDSIDRGDYILILRDYEVEVIEGEPSVPQNVEGVTQYSELEWTNDPTDLKQAARDGSMCARVFLRFHKIKW